MTLAGPVFAKGWSSTFPAIQLGAGGAAAADRTVGLPIELVAEQTLQNEGEHVDGRDVIADSIRRARKTVGGEHAHSGGGDEQSSDNGPTSWQAAGTPNAPRRSSLLQFRRRHGPEVGHHVPQIGTDCVVTGQCEAVESTMSRMLDTWETATYT